jgi:hypothetical protein
LFKFVAERFKWGSISLRDVHVRPA